MRSPRSTFQLRAAALATAATLALGAAACGSSSDDDSSSSGGSDQEQARATVETLNAAIKDGDAGKVCDQLNEDAQKQLAAGGRCSTAWSRRSTAGSAGSSGSWASAEVVRATA